MGAERPGTRVGRVCATPVGRGEVFAGCWASRRPPPRLGAWARYAAPPSAGKVTPLGVCEITGPQGCCATKLGQPAPASQPAYLRAGSLANATRRGCADPPLTN